MKKYLCLIFLLVQACLSASSQGCIPVRNISGFGQYNLADNAFTQAQWQLDLTNRYFRSYRDFKERNDLKTPTQNQSVNEVYTFDISVSKFLENGWSIMFNLPITSNVRTSSVEHGGFNTPRHSTRSFGTGDLRVTAYKWLKVPQPNENWNIQAGLGIKFPTGAYNYQDYFYRNDTTKVLSAVNPSIQLGDGGTGIITELNLFYHLTKALSIYGDFYYLLSPRNENGTLYTMGRTPTALQLQSDGVNNSVPDVFSLHAGVNLNIKNFAFSVALRDEGTPVYDVIGMSDGVRRAGHYLSVEPGIMYRMKRVTVFSYLPLVVDRRIAQNVADKKASFISGTHVVGPGGSANVVYFAGATFKF